jgi:hypothetical protein
MTSTGLPSSVAGVKVTAIRGAVELSVKDCSSIRTLRPQPLLEMID